MEKKDKTDYGAAYRQYCIYAKGMSFKKFCEEQNYDYTKFSRYVNKAYWTASKQERDSIGCKCVPLEIETESSVSLPSTDSSVVVWEDEKSGISISSIEVVLSNGLQLKMEWTLTHEFKCQWLKVTLNNLFTK